MNAITLEVTRITLAAGLFAIGAEMPPGYLAKHAKGLLVMIVPTMAFGWLIVAGTSSKSELALKCLGHLYHQPSSTLSSLSSTSYLPWSSLLALLPQILSFPLRSSVRAIDIFSLIIGSVNAVVQVGRTLQTMCSRIYAISCRRNPLRTMALHIPS